MDPPDDDQSLAPRALVDGQADSGRHADLTREVDARPASTGNWSTELDEDPSPAETGRHAAAVLSTMDHDELSSTGSHRVLVTRPSHRRWVPAGVGAAVLSILSVVLLTSGFGSDPAARTGADEAARTGTAPTSAPTTTEAPLPAPVMSTIVITPGTPGSGVGQRSSSATRATITSSAARTASAPGSSTAAPIAAPPPVVTTTSESPTVEETTEPTSETTAPTSVTTSTALGTGDLPPA